MADTGTSIAQLIGQLKTSNANLPAAMSAVGGKEGGGESRSIVVNVNAAPATTQQNTQTEIVNQEKVINSLDRIYDVLMQQLNFNRKEDQERQMELQVKPQDFQKQMVDSQKQVVTAVREGKREDSSFMSTIGGLVGAFGSFIPKMGGLITAIGGFAPAIATLVAAVAGFKAVSSALSWAAEKLGSTSISPGLGGFFPNAPGGTDDGSGKIPKIFQREPSDGPRTGPMLGEPGKPGSGTIKRWDDVEYGTKQGKFSFKPEIASIIKETAEKSGLDENYLRTMAHIESKGNPTAFNKGSKAAGLYQFIPSTAKSYGLRGKEFDPRANAMAAARLSLDNKKILEKAGIEATPEMLYIAHQQGPQGAIDLVKYAKEGRSFSQLPGTLQRNIKSNVPGRKALGAEEFLNFWKKGYREHASIAGIPKKEEPSLVDKGIDKLKKWTGIEDNDETSKNMVKTSELRVKGGLDGQAFKGGETEEGTINLARVIQAQEKDLPGGLNRFSAFNDEYHGKANPKSKHTKGLGLDFSLKDAKYSSEASNFVKQQLIGSGLSEEDFKIINEYKNPSKHSTGGHIHVNFANKEAAEKYSKFTKEGESSTYAKLEKQLPEGGRYGEEESEQEETNEPVIREPVSASKEATPSGGTALDAAFAKLGAEADSEGMAGFGGLATILGGLGGGIGGENLLPKFDEKVAELGGGEEKGKAYAPDFERMTNLLSTIASNTGDMAEKGDEKEEKTASKEESKTEEQSQQEQPTALPETKPSDTSKAIEKPPEEKGFLDKIGEGISDIGSNISNMFGFGDKSTGKTPTVSKENSFMPSELSSSLIAQNFGTQNQQSNSPFGSLGSIFSTAGTMSGGISSVMSGIAGMKGGDPRSIINSVNGMLGMGRGTFGGMGGFGGNYPGRSGVDGSGIPNRREDGFGFGIPGMGGIGNGASGTLGGLGRVLSGVGGMMGGGMLGGLGSVLRGFGGNYPGRSGVDGSGMPNRRGDVFGIPGMLGSMGNIGGMLGGLGVTGFGGTAKTIGQVGGLLGNLSGMMNGGGNLGGMGGLLGNTFGGPMGGLIGSAGGGALSGLFNSISSGGGIGDAVSGLLGGALGSTGGVGGILGSLGVTGFGGGFNPTVSKEGTGQYPGREGGNGGSLDEMMMKNLGIQREEGFPTMGGMGKDEYLKRQARGETFDPKTGAGSGGTSTPIQPRSMGDIGEGLSGLGKIGKDLGGAIFGGIGSLFGMGDGIASKGAGDDVASMKQQHGDSSGGMLESLGVSGIGSALGTSSLMSEGSSMMGGALDGLQSSFSSMMGSGSSGGGESASSGGGSSTAIGNAGGGGGGSGGGSPGFKSGDQRAGSSSGAMGIQMGVRNEESILQKAQYSVIRIV